MFLKKTEIIDFIKEESSNFLFDLVECRVKSEDLYDVYIFTVVLRDQEELIETWEDISSDVALYFQGGLKTEIEIWNIYILFLVQASVDRQKRYLIEQNKYSSRKLVIEEIKSPITEESIEDIINDKLFRVKINSVSSLSNSNRTESISNKLETSYKKLFDVINESNEKPSVLFNKYLGMLKNEH
jgi:hypothetical protein